MNDGQKPATGAPKSQCIMHFSRLLLETTKNILDTYWKVCKKTKAREQHVDNTQGQNQGEKGEVKMFWSLDLLFQLRESNMFHMAYKYMYIVNN